MENTEAKVIYYIIIAEHFGQIITQPSEKSVNAREPIQVTWLINS